MIFELMEVILLQAIMPLVILYMQVIFRDSTNVLKK